jgi:hypothetical protein
MRKLSVVAALAAFLAVLAAPVADARRGDDKRGKSKVIKLFATTVQSVELDLGDPGLSLGDRFVFSDDLRRRRGGPVIGETGAECVVTRIDEPTYSVTFHCVGTASLPRGQITVQGLVQFAQQGPARFKLAVTGGTGRFREADGVVKVRELSETESILRFKLDL